MKRAYLSAYNLVMFLFWTAFFVYEVGNGFPMNSTSLLLLNIAQVSALLEIVHAALKWVRSPVFTTAIQIFSRVFVLAFINLLPQSEQITVLGISGLHLITIAWGVTEMVRYSYYFFVLQNKDIGWLSFLRYTLFIVLYPTGVIGEWMILISQIQMNGWVFSVFNIFLGVVMLSYLYFFPQLYGYMFKQRKKKLSK